MAKGILKVSRTNKGKIYVELDKLNGKPPMPLSYVVFPNTDLNGKECEYTVDSKGVFISIKVDGKEVWSRVPAPAITTAKGTITNNNDSKYQDSLSLPNTFLPKDVRNKVNSLPDIDNFALKMQKAARYERDMGKGTYKFLFFKKDDRERVYFEIRANYGHFKDNFDALCKRQSQQAESLFPNNAIKILLQPQWRLVLGLGGESVYETSMTLHHLYGIPYLPASSIKGVLRSWVISQIFAQPENVPDTEKNHPLVNAEYRAITQSKLFCTIFGCPKDSKKVIFEGGHPKIKIEKGEEKYVYDESELSALGNEHQGIVTFFDAFPTSAPIVKADVMNVHYKDWYKDVSYSPPTDTQRTNPVLFLTVSNENNLQFQTYIAISDDKMKLGDIQGHERFLSDSGLNADSYLLDLVKYWLTQALTQHGIGAKTAVGYGYMTDTQPTQ